MIVLGAKEVEDGTVSVRHRDNEDLVTQPLEEFIAQITTEIANRSL
jgi:threonyl-tRNA synthetase